MTAEGVALGAHDGGRLASRHPDQPAERLPELLRLHVVREAAEGGAGEAAVRRAGGRVTEATERAVVHVVDVAEGKGLGKDVAVELRVVPRPGHAADVDQLSDAVGVQHVDKLVERAGRVPDREDGERGDLVHGADCTREGRRHDVTARPAAAGTRRRDGAGRSGPPRRLVQLVAGVSMTPARVLQRLTARLRHVHAAVRLELLLPDRLRGLVALAQDLLPLVVDPGLQVLEGLLVARLEEVREASLPLEPGDRARPSPWAGR